jgi:phosphoglucosamine mutase
MLRFGTDGVRGLANVELTPELVLALGRAAARVLASPPGADRRFIVGRDTRRSGPLLQAALSAGLASEGVSVTDVGVLATPAVAYLSAEEAAPAAVISASHNRYWDNGVKFFSSGGSKLPDAVEDALEAELEVLLSHPASPPASPPASHPPKNSSPAGGAPELVGDIDNDADALERYEHHVLSALEGRRLGGLRVALDCANGAAFASAPAVFERAGADLVAVLAAEPNGTNINENCGSTDPGQLARAVVAEGADLGLAFDGDADRVIAVDASGNVVDGDRLLALFSTDLAGRGLLSGGTVVVTVMTNLGFHQAMKAAGVKVETVGVGDRNVLEALDLHGWALGGEQSGHIVFRSLATTGDGVLSGLLLADLITRRGARLEDMAAGALQRCPQVLRNVAVADRDGLDEAEAVWEEVRKVEAELGGGGRVLLRPSGTEPLVRVMVEAPSQVVAEAAVERIVAALHATLGSPGHV